MKLLITLLLFVLSLSTFAQQIETASMPENIAQEKRAVVAVTDANIIYRGIENKINIAVAGIDASKVTVSAPGIFRNVGQSGEYSWNVIGVTGDRVKLSIVYKLPDGHSKIEHKEFEIRHLKPLRSQINGYGAEGCIVQQTIEQLKDAKISVITDDAIIGFRNIYVKSFVIGWDGNSHIIDGDTIPDKVYKEIIKQKPGTIFSITAIQFTTQATVYACKTSNIKVMVVKDI